MYIIILTFVLMSVLTSQTFQTYQQFSNHLKQKYKDDDTRLKRSFELLFSKEHATTTPILKCGTPLFLEYKSTKHKLSEQTIQTIQHILKPLSRGSNSYTSSSGKFNISYETTGPDSVSVEDLNTNSVPDYVERIAEYLDYSYTIEVTQEGYKDPIRSTYSVALKNIGSYGVTYTSGDSTVITIHNNFLNFPKNTDPDGHVLGAAKVTAAHEFKHAIQYAISRWNEGNWVELDATWAEELVYDETNDYYNYLTHNSCQLTQPHTSLNDGGTGSYYDVIWQIYLSERYGNNIIGDLWKRRQNSPNENFIDSYKYIINARGSSIENAISSYSLANYFTNIRTIKNFGYSEAVSYRKAPIYGTYSIIEQGHSHKINHWSSHYISINKPLKSLNISFKRSDTQVRMHLVYRLDYVTRIRYSINPLSFNSNRATLNGQSEWESPDTVVEAIIISNTSPTQSAEYTLSINEVQDVELSNNTASENSSAYAYVGKFSTRSRTSNTYSYTLVSGAGDSDNNFFTIQNDSLLLTEPMDYEKNPYFQIRVRAVGEDLSQFEKNFYIYLLDIDEIPPVITYTTQYSSLSKRQIQLYINSNEPLESTPLITANNTSFLSAQIEATRFVFEYILDNDSVSFKVDVQDVTGNKSSKTFDIYWPQSSALQIDNALKIQSEEYPNYVIEKKPLNIYPPNLSPLSEQYVLTTLKPHHSPYYITFKTDSFFVQNQNVGLYTYNGTSWDYLTGEMNQYGVLRTSIKGNRNGTFAVFYNTSHTRYKPKSSSLIKNYPNPFNPSTTIAFELNTAQTVSLTIYNILGERIKTLVNHHLEYGSHEFVWDGTNHQYQNVPSGVYFYQLTGKDFTYAKKMVLLK